MFLLFWDQVEAAEYVFCGAMILMMLSMIISLIEIQTSVRALDFAFEEP